MENHGLGTHNDKMYGKSSTENTPQFIRPFGWPIIWNSFEKSPLHMSIVHDIDYETMTD